MPLDATRQTADSATPPPRSRRRPRRASSPRVAAVSAVTLAAASVFGTVAAVPASADVPCADGSSPAQNSTVTCTVAGNATLTVPSGTTSVDVEVVGGGGGAGYPARSHIGGNAANVSGSLTLPAGTAYLYVIVGTAGFGDNHGTSGGGGASAVLAEDSGHNLLAKLVVAGGGGGGAYNGNGGNAGSAGTSDNAQAVSGPGQAGSGAVGGAGGTGNYAGGTAGGSNNPSALAVAAGGTGGLLPSSARGGAGGGGYAGGGGGGASTQGILNTNVAGGGGGSSLASSYLGAASITLENGTGGVQLPGLVAGDGSTGSVSLTFNGQAVAGAPTGVTAKPGDGKATVSFTAPASDGGSTITSYTVTSAPDGKTATCPGSPCTVTGLSNGTAYTFTVVATNDNGDSAASAASAAVTPATPPGVPTGVGATGGDGSASVSWTPPASTGGSPITGYTVTSAPGGKTATCSTSPCVVNGLDNGTDYTFTVVATNAIGDSAASAASGSVSVRSVPGHPTITNVSHGSGTATVDFTAPDDDGGAKITGYTLSASPGGASVSCSSSPCTLTGLTNGKAYTLQLTATNAAGSSEAAVTTKPVTPATVPDSPADLKVTRGDGEATLTFDGPASDGGSEVTGYQVSTDGGKTWSALEVDGSGPYKATVTGLSNGNAYDIAVRAVNDEGASASTSLSTVTPAGKPGTPAGVTAARGDGQATVSWTSPKDNGAAIDGYQVYVPQLDKTVDCDNGSPCVVEGLVNGKSYTFQVRAHNSEGYSVYSEASAEVTPATTAKAPGLVWLVSGNESLTMRFVATSEADNGGDAVTGYEYSLDNGDWLSLSSSPLNGSDDRIGVITGLTNGHSYSLKLRAVNGLGGGSASAALSQTPATSPDAPGSVKVSSSKGTTTVSWKAPKSDGGSPITGYTVTAQPGGTQCTADGDETSCDITGLKAGEKYEFFVTASNAAEQRTGTGPSQSASSGSVLLTDVPSAPAQLAVIPGDRTATLTFTVPASDGGKPVKGYEVSTDGGDSWRGVDTTTVSPSTARTAMLGGLLNGRTYEISVRARNDDGAGKGTPSVSTTLQVWFTDPVSPADRATEIPVPAKPSSFKGKATRTVATNRSHDGTVAANVSGLAGRQLQPEQAVQIGDKVFGNGNAKLTSGGKKLLKSMAQSLTYVDAVSCEGYTNYGSSTKAKLTRLSKARASAICKALGSYAKQVDVRSTTGYGGDHPAVVGGTNAQRVDNRRVVVVIDR